MVTVSSPLMTMSATGLSRCCSIPDPPTRDLRRFHQSPDGIEHDPELPVNLPFHLIQPPEYVLMRGGQLPQPDERPHDGDVGLNIATPSSVKTYGIYRRPPRPVEVANCDLKVSVSPTVNWNMSRAGEATSTKAPGRGLSSCSTSGARRGRWVHVCPCSAGVLRFP
jgi:hypothetical protein